MMVYLLFLFTVSPEETNPISRTLGRSDIRFVFSSRVMAYEGLRSVRGLAVW